MEIFTHLKGDGVCDLLYTKEGCGLACSAPVEIVEGRRRGKDRLETQVPLFDTTAFVYSNLVIMSSQL